MKKYYISALITILYIPIVTIVGELFAPIKNFIKAYFWHHWLGKSVILVLLFAAISFVLGLRKKESQIADEKYLSWITGLATLGAIAILLFFTFEYLRNLTRGG